MALVHHVNLLTALTLFFPCNETSSGATSPPQGLSPFPLQGVSGDVSPDPADVGNSTTTTMFPAGGGFSVEPVTIRDEPETFQDCMESLISTCNIRLEVLRRHCSSYFHLKRIRSLCYRHLFELKGGLPIYHIWEEIIYLRKKVVEAYSDAVCNLLVFSISSAVKGGIYIHIGPHMIRASCSLRVNRLLLQMILFAKNLHGNSFACLKSMAPKGVASMAETSGSSASPTEYMADWISAYSKPESGDNVESGPYDRSMTVTEGSCGVSNKSHLELGKAGSRLSFRGVSSNCQQQGALIGSSHDARLQVPMPQDMSCIYSISLEKMPTAPRSVKCGDADESSRLAEHTSPQEQFILNSSGAGGSGNPHFSSALRTTPFTETSFTPVLPELIEVDPQHLRKFGLASEDDTLKMIGSHGMGANRSMQYIAILDSGAAYHCTGDRSQLSDYCDGEAPVPFLQGASGTLMEVCGTGSIHNENFQVKGVLYVPDLNNRPNTHMTIFSVDKLNEFGYNIHFDYDGTVSVVDYKRTWNLRHEIVGKASPYYGQFMLDYLRIPLNREPVPKSEGPGLLKSLLNASVSDWSSITGRLFQRTTCPPRPPV